MTQIQIQLRNWRNKVVNASLHNELTDKNDTEIKDFDKTLWIFAWLGRRIADSSESVNWKTAVYHASYFPGSQTWVIECDGATQGLIVFHPQLSPISGVAIIMISALGSARRNRRIGLNRFLRVQGFSGIGRALLRHASQVSNSLGHKGVVGLYSSPKAEGFYEKAGLIRSGIVDHRGFAYFESPQ